MSDYKLFYWPAPFRGQFVRALLAFTRVSWAEVDDGAIVECMTGPVSKMPVPFMGPPILVEKASGFAISQMPAIIFYLADKLGLFPPTPELRALSIKVVNDANDVLDELTLHGGREMWTAKSWRVFEPRLSKWMQLWEELGQRHGLGPTSGYLLGGDGPGVADVITSTLWATMTDRFPGIGTMLHKAAPQTAALTLRIAALPQLSELATQARRDYGNAYCGGQIEASLRKVAS